MPVGTPLVPRNGAVAISTLYMDFNTFDITSTQNSENITPYGSNVGCVNAFNATPDITIDVGAFALAHNTSSGLSLPTVGGTVGTSGNGLLTGIGTTATCTFTLDTGCTESGNVGCTSMKISHGRMRASVPVALTLRQSSDFTEVWATS